MIILAIESLLVFWHYSPLLMACSVGLVRTAWHWWEKLQIFLEEKMHLNSKADKADYLRPTFRDHF